MIQQNKIPLPIALPNPQSYPKYQMLFYAFSSWRLLVYNELNLNIDFHGVLYFDMKWKEEKNLLSNIPQPHDKYS